MTHPPFAVDDLVGLDADEARARLAAAGVPVGAEVETRSPRPVVLEGPLRVVRVRRSVGGLVELVVTRERFLPTPPRG